MLFTLPAPAKLNIYLHITGRREDGYHLLDSGVTFLSLCDSITLHKSRCADTVAVTGRYAEDVTPLKHNSCLKALRFFREASSADLPFFHITIKKNIPVKAGLGGGSADAAAILRGLQQRFPLPESTLYSIALACGADVPVCLQPGKDAVIRGIGEEITQQDMSFIDKNCGVILLYKKGCGASTPDIFKRYHESGAMYQCGDNTPGTNALTAAAVSLLSDISRMIDILHDRQAVHAGMTGSGSAVFGIFPLNTLPGIAKEIKRIAPDIDVYPCSRFA